MSIGVHFHIQFEDCSLTDTFIFMFVELLYNYLDQNNLPFTVTGSSFKGATINLCIHNATLATNQLIDSLKHS